MNATPPAPYPHRRWTLTGSLLHRPRLLALARLLLALSGLLLLGLIGATYAMGLVPTAFDREQNCTYAAEQAYPPLAGVSARPGEVIPLDWQVFVVPGSCRDWNGVRLVRRNETVPSREATYPVGAETLEIVPPGQPARTILHASIIVTAPAQLGFYETAWQLQAANGLYFGPVMTRRIQVYDSSPSSAAPPPPFPNQAPETITGVLLSWVLSIFKYAAPALMAFVFVWWRAGNFLNELYGLKPPASGHRHVLTILFGLWTPYVRAQRSQIEYDPAYAAAAVIGGPAWLIVAENTAAVIERGAGFSRIVGPGITFLRQHERVRAAVDLNTQQWRNRERTFTKDGIPIEVDVDLVYKLTERTMDGDAPPEPPYALGPLMRLRQRLGWHVPAAVREASRPHRFSREAVRRVTYETASSGPGQPTDWIVNFAKMRSGDIADEIAERRLDELCAPDDPDRHPFREIVQAGLEAARRVGQRLGIDVIDMHMGTIDPSKELLKDYREQYVNQLIANWQIEWERRARLLDEEGKARALQAVEEARAEAQANMIQALTEGYRIAVGDNIDPKVSHEVIALRFIDTLEALMQNSRGQPPNVDLVL